MNQYDTFLSYLKDDKNIVRAVCHEVLKYVFKPHKTLPEHVRELYLLVPPPYFWADKADKKASRDRLTNILLRHLRPGHAGGYDHAARFRCMADSLRRIAAHPESYVFPKPTVKALLKSEGEQEVECRPICAYLDIRAKLLTSLMARYMQSWLEPMLHETNMAYRARRTWMGEENVAVTKTSYAIDYIMRWRAAHDGQHVYVAECDIRKFFDTIHHADLCRVFAEMHRRAGKKDKQFETLFCRFVDSFDFARDVMVYNNGHDEWWAQHLRHAYRPDKRYLFKWVPGINKPAGIPQGVAMSPCIVNMLLNMIDEEMLGDRLQNGHIADPDLLYIRYCDDNLLAHTDKATCTQLIERYYQVLQQHHLHPHDFQSVGMLKRKGMADYWNAKSKEPFLWGKGNGDASLWIGFVGYEMRYDGAIRLRKSSVAKTAEGIFKDSEKIKHSGAKAPDKLEHFRNKGVRGSTLDGISCITDDTPYRKQRALLEQLKARKTRRLEEIISSLG